MQYDFPKKNTNKNENQPIQQNITTSPSVFASASWSNQKGLITVDGGRNPPAPLDRYIKSSHYTPWN